MNKTSKRQRGNHDRRAAAATIVLLSVTFSLLASPDSLTMAFLALPAGLRQFADTPWTVLTYMFVHKDVPHLLFNLMVLLTFSIPIGRMYGWRHIAGLYVCGGLSGGLMYALVYGSLLHGQNPLIGASAAVMAIVAAAAVKNPRLYVPPLGSLGFRIVAVAVFAISLTGTLLGNVGGTVAHLGGILAGAVYAVNLKRHKIQARADGDNPAELENLRRKVAVSGFESLTAEERRRLFQLSASNTSKHKKHLQ